MSNCLELTEVLVESVMKGEGEREEGVDGGKEMVWYLKHMHSQAHGSDTDSVVPLYRPSTHWQLAEPVMLVKLYSGQGAHASLPYPSLNVPSGHSVRREKT